MGTTGFHESKGSDALDGYPRHFRRKAENSRWLEVREENPYKEPLARTEAFQRLRLCYARRPRQFVSGLWFRQHLRLSALTRQRDGLGMYLGPTGSRLLRHFDR